MVPLILVQFQYFTPQIRKWADSLTGKIPDLQSGVWVSITHRSTRDLNNIFIFYQIAGAMVKSSKKDHQRVAISANRGKNII